ncbi:calcium-binding protein, partial [Methylosoma difficile]
SGNDLVIGYGTTDVLKVANFFSGQAINTAYAISSFQFSNAVTWGYAELLARQQGTAGNDTLYAINGYANTINALAGDDTVYGGDGKDTLNGGDGADSLYGYGDADTLNGNAGNDGLSGGDGTDTLNGGTGSDALTGGEGADTYLISKTDGADTLYNVDSDGSVDTIKFTDLKSTELTALYDDGAGNLILKYGTAGNQLTVSGFFNNYANAKVDKFTFTDSTLTADTIITTRHNGTDANDILYGLAGNTNTLNGLGGNDSLNGAELA